jgi:uncharacterized damage-inducible protein DinB
MLAELVDLFAYNRWANERELAAAGRVAVGDLGRPFGASHGSLLGTLLHLHAVEHAWLARWLGTPAGAAPDVDAVVDVPTLQACWEQLWPRQEAFLAGLSESDLRRPVAIRTRAGYETMQPLDATLLHVVNHATYHRGQVTSLLRELSAEPVATDYFLYYDAVHRRP